MEPSGFPSETAAPRLASRLSSRCRFASRLALIFASSSASSSESSESSESSLLWRLPPLLEAEPSCFFRRFFSFLLSSPRACRFLLPSLSAWSFEFLWCGLREPFSPRLLAALLFFLSSLSSFFLLLSAFLCALSIIASVWRFSLSIALRWILAPGWSEWMKSSTSLRFLNLRSSRLLPLPYL